MLLRCVGTVGRRHKRRRVGFNRPRVDLDMWSAKIAGRGGKRFAGTVLLLLVAAALVAGLALTHGALGWTDVAGVAAPGDITATENSGGAMIRLTLGYDRNGDSRATVTARRGDKPVAGGQVSIGIARLGRARERTILLHGSGRGSWSAPAAMPSTGAWQIAVKVREGSRVTLGRFFLYETGRPQGSGLAAQLAPMPAHGHQLSGAVTMGRFVARVVATPLYGGAYAFRAVLEPSAHSQRLPQSITLDLTMYEMDMGNNSATLKRVASGAYQGKVQLPMEGPWSLKISAGGASGRAAMIVGASRASQPPMISPGGFGGARLVTHLPYQGFVTEMRANRLGRLNSGAAQAGRTPHGVDFVPHRPYALVSDMGSNDVRMIDLRTGQTVTVIPAGLAPAHIAFTPDGRKAFVTDFLSADVSVISVPERRLLARVPVGLNPHGIDISHDGGVVYVACAHGGGVWVINTRTNHVVATIPTGLEPYGVTVGTSGSNVIYVSDYAMNAVDVVSTTRKRVIKRIPVGSAPALMVAAPNGNLYVADHGSAEVTVISMETNRVVGEIAVGKGPHGLDVTPDGKYVYVADNNSNTISIISTRLGRTVRTVRVPGEPNEVALIQRDDVKP